MPAAPVRYLGVYEPGSPHSYANVDQFAREVGRRPNLVLYYSGWPERFKTAFAQTAAAHGATTLVEMDPTGISLERIAESRIMIDSARLLVLKAAYMMDTVGNKFARSEIAQIKVLAPNMACKVIDWAIQAHGGGGVSDDFPLAYGYAHARTIRLADGPDEVHRNQIGKLELKKYDRLTN